MSTDLHCTTYDTLLQAALPHLVSYPQLLPHIGSAWDDSNNRILFIAESHYLAATSAGKSNSATWYQRNQSSLTDWDFQHINTRRIVNAADEYAVSKKGYIRAYSIFYNLKKAVFEACQVKSTDNAIFQNFGFYNYFQRPAEITGKSIKNADIDDEIAYNTLKAVVEITKPTALIFVSRKAYNSFWSIRNNRKDFILPPIHKCVSHPASAWWNKPSKANHGISGKDKFIQIIKTLDLKLPGQAA